MTDDLERWTDALPTFRYKVIPHGSRSSSERRQMRRWCMDRFGSNRLLTDDAGVVWVSQSTVWRHHNGEFGFRNADHAFEFKMRWGGV
ncbi:MAG: hypothetical protein EOO77_45140 [Oxalobacteraceae bacterium]|nr:MAG: hypothetical protein EOO77_45140 [Oxalobacteraceae bacterium]